MTRTKAAGKVAQEISYEVKFFINEKPAKRKARMYNIIGPNPSGKYDQEVGSDKDLLVLEKPLRFYVEDNGTWNGYYDTKAETYAKTGLMKLVSPPIPLRLEVKKFIANKETPMDKNDKVNAVFTVEDPVEENIIRGRSASPASKSGRDFIKNIRWKTRFQTTKNDAVKNNDNCIRSYAPNAFQSRCRADGSKVKATDVLCTIKNKKLIPLAAHKSDANLGVAPINWKSKTAIIVFRPPPVLGDNYAFGVALANEKGEEIKLRNKPKKPQISLWKKVKIRLIALQNGINYGSIKMEQVKNIYHDAFIEVEPPEGKNRIFLTKQKWIDFLDSSVYKTWHRKAWIAYKKKNGGKDLLDNLDDYSFPQTPGAKGVKNLTPPSESKADPKHTSDELLDRLTDVIVRANLNKNEKKQINNLKLGAGIGLCILYVRYASAEGGASGMTFGWPPKMFRVLVAGDDTNTFAHEMGHALFLNHGATRCLDVDQFLGGGNTVDGSIIVHSEDASTYGPYWDEHDGEDLISCVMSYDSWFYDDQGGELANSVDWHFCGVCLLYLRFYDIYKMSKDLKSNPTFRKLNYLRVKPQIAIAEEMKMGKVKTLVYWEFNNSLTMGVKDRKRLLALYPKENVANNNGKKYWKDICHHPRGRWVWSPKNAVVKVRKRDDIWESVLTPAKPTSPGKPMEIKFRMRYGPKKADVVESNPLRVTITK